MFPSPNILFPSIFLYGTNCVNICAVSRIFTINDRYTIARHSGQLSLPRGYEMETRSTLENPSTWLYDALTGGGSSAGIAVNDESALTLAAVYACNRVLADSIASLPINLFKRGADGDIMPASNRHEDELLSSTPSKLYTSYTFRSTLQFHLGLRGNAYARIIHDGRGGAKELHILHPNFVRPFFYQNDLFYEVTPNQAAGDTFTGRVVLRRDEVLHIAALSTDGLIGRSPITLLRDTIGISLSNRGYVSNIHKNGGRLRGVLKHPSKLAPEQVDSLRDNFQKPINSGGFPVLQNGVEFQAISLSPADAEFINTANLTTLDIARAYRIPPHMIGDLERATFSNIEHQALEFVKHTLLPWLKNWEQELNRKLLPKEIQGTHFFRFNVEGMLRGDIKARYEAYTKAIQWGILNRDEVRELENRNKIPDGLGETFLTPLNMVAMGEEQDSGDQNTDKNNNQGNEDQGQRRFEAA